MPANLAQTDGNAAMAYYGEVPWHGLGTSVGHAMSSAEAISLGGLDWTVDPVPIFLADGTGIPGKKAIKRSDTNVVFNVLSDNFTPVQNAESFAFLDSMVARGSVAYHTVGALGRGQRVWMLAKMPGHIKVKGDDITEKYLLLANGHDGSLAMRCLFTPIRVVCQNTLSAALAAQGRNIIGAVSRRRKSGRPLTGCYIRHTGNVADKVESARETLGLADQFFEDVAAKFSSMASVNLVGETADAYFNDVFPDPVPDENGEVSDHAAANARETRDVLFDLFETGMGNDRPGIAGTLWAAYNAVTEYVDHAKESRASSLSITDQRSNHLSNIWFGAGASIKSKAFDAAMTFVGAR